MGNTNTPNDPTAPTPGGEGRLRGKELTGSETKRAADHVQYEEGHDPDKELRLDDEKDTLYDDGLDLEDDDPDTLAGTRGKSSGIKP